MLAGNAARILCLWFNSIFAITHLYDRRITGIGTYVGWLKSDLLGMPSPTVSSLDPSSRRRLIELFERVGKQKFPSLFSQLQNHESNRLELDLVLAETLHLRDATESRIFELYDSVVRKLLSLREVQTERRQSKSTEV